MACSDEDIRNTRIMTTTEEQQVAEDEAKVAKMMDLTSKRLLVDPSELTLADYIDHMQMEIYRRGETLITVGAGAEGDNGDGILSSKVSVLNLIRSQPRRLRQSCKITGESGRQAKLLPNLTPLT